MTDPKTPVKVENGKILEMPKKVSMRQTVKNQTATIKNLVAQMAAREKFINNKTKFEAEVDCPECEGKGKITKRKGLEIDFIDCPACLTEGRLYFQGIGDFFVKSHFENKKAEDAAAVKEAEAKAQLAAQKKEKDEGEK